MPYPDPRYRPDCTRCQGLCCIAHGHQTAHGFPAPKPEDTRCRNLDPETFRCAAFERLEEDGYLTCRAYDCFGAGPIVSELMNRDGAAWPEMTPEHRARHFDDFRRLSRLQCLLGYVRADPALAGHPFGDELGNIIDAYEATGELSPREEVRALLMRYNELVTHILRAVGYLD